MYQNIFKFCSLKHVTLKNEIKLLLRKMSHSLLNKPTRKVILDEVP